MNKTMESLIKKSANENPGRCGFFGRYGFVGSAAYQFAETPENEGEGTPLWENCEKLFALDIPMVSVDAKEFFLGAQMAKTIARHQYQGHPKVFYILSKNGHLSMAAESEEGDGLSYAELSECSLEGEIVVDVKFVIPLKARRMKLGFGMFNGHNVIKIETPEVTAIVSSLDPSEEKLAALRKLLDFGDAP